MSDSLHRQFILNTSIFDAKLWHASPWKLKILLYLIANTNTHSDQHLNITIDKGQLLRSYRRISTDCSYNIGFRIAKPAPSNIKFYCDELESEGRITQAKTKHGVLFTITGPTMSDVKPKTTTRRPVQTALFSHHPFVTEEERVTLALLDSIEGYQFDFNSDLDFVHSLSADFPSLNLVEHIKDWKTWLWDNRHNLKGQIRYRSRLRNWLKIAMEKKHGISSIKRKSKPSSKESKKFSEVYE